MSLLSRLTERVGELIDDVTLPAELARRLDEAERLLLVSGDADGALTLLAEVDRVRAGTWRGRVLAGLAYEMRGELERAAAELGAAVEERDDTIARVALGRIATRLGALQTARSHFDRALSRRPADAERLEILLAIASLDERIGPRSRAVPALRPALRLAPTDASLMVRLAAALEDEGDLDGAQAALRPAVDLEPAPLDALLKVGALGLRRGGAGDLADARRAYSRILERSPDNPDALEGLASAHRAEGRLAEALPLLHHALTTASRSAQWRLQHAIGRCYLASGQLDQALTAFRAAAATGADAAALMLDLADAALRSGLPDEALEAARAAVRDAPMNRSARALLGRCELRAGLVAEAQRTLSALRAARMAVDELHAIGELALRTGDAIEALALLREAAVLVPGRAGLAELIEEAVRELAPRLPELPGVESLSPPQLAPFLDRLSEAVAQHPLLTDLIPRATALRQHLDTPLTVAVLGEFNAGKSTLINAFFAEDIVATGVLPTTCHVNVIRYGPRAVARWTTTDGDVQEIPYVEAQRLTKREPESIAALEFCYPHPDLRSIHFWDTPGFNAPDSTHEARARDALRRADAVIWMLDANQALTSTEFDRLEAIPNRAEKLLVVLNKADRLDGDPTARAEVEAHVRRYLGDACVGLYWLSALGALDARRAALASDGAVSSVAVRPSGGGDATGSRASTDGWAEFEGAVREQIFERAGRLKSLEVATGLRGLLREALQRAESARALVTSSSTEVAERRVALAAQRARWAAEVGAPTRAALNEALHAARGRIADEVVQLSAPGPGVFARRELAEADRVAVRGRLLERATAAYRGVVSSVRSHADAVDTPLVALVEATATRLGPPESRTLRRRLEAYLAETAALRRTLHERLEEAPKGVAAALSRELGDRVLEAVAAEGSRTEAERDAALQRLLPPVGAEHIAQVDSWGEEYLAAASRLCDHVERDLDILALDFEHRILRPFAAVLAAIRDDEVDAARDALE